MWRPWMFLGVLPILLLGGAAYFVLVTPAFQTSATTIERSLDIGAKKLEKHIDQQLDALDTPTSDANIPKAHNDERAKRIAPPRPPAKEKQALGDEQLEALFTQEPSAEELQKLSDKQLEALFSHSSSDGDLLSDEELA